MERGTDVCRGSRQFADPYEPWSRGWPVAFAGACFYPTDKELEKLFSQNEIVENPPGQTADGLVGHGELQEA